MFQIDSDIPGSLSRRDDTALQTKKNRTKNSSVPVRLDGSHARIHAVDRAAWKADIANSTM
jgi:hypothetical protein